MYREPESYNRHGGHDAVSGHLHVNDSLQNYPALILNADFRPLSYFPLSIWSWQDAIKAVCRDAVTVVSEYDRFVSSPSMDMKLPSVLALKEYIPQSQNPAFTRFNVFLRDEWECQYCGDEYKTSHLTFDHVIPRSKGGRTTWENIVTACRRCNEIKGARLPHQCNMHPRQTPHQPSLYELQNKGRKFPPNFLHESWGGFSLLGQRIGRAVMPDLETVTAACDKNGGQHGINAQAKT